MSLPGKYEDQKVRVVIDGRYIREPKTGIGVYTENVVRELTKISRGDEFILIVAEQPKDLVAENLRIVCYELLGRRFVHRVWENTFLLTFLHRVQADVYFSPLFFLPLLAQSRMPHYSHTQRKFFRRLKLVVTVHDVIPFLHPKISTFRLNWRLRLFLPASLRVADLIVTDSDASKRDIVRLFHLPEEKIQVVPLGKSERYRKITNRTSLRNVRDSYRLPRSFILYVGMIEPRKNLDLLIRAYSLLPPSRRNGVKLVLAGTLGWKSDQILSLVKQQGLQRDVQFTGYIPDEDLPALYNLGTIFVYPSLYEGFGLPVLEAMACGLPVVVSNTASLPEVVGDAGISIDPTNASELSQILEDLLRDDDRREKLKRASLARAQRFTWSATAEQLLESFHSIYDRVPRG